MLSTDGFMQRAVGRARAGRLYLTFVPGLAEWHTRIERPIKMGSTKDCILAQLFGGYREGVDALGLDDVETVELGFRGSTTELRSVAAFGQYYKILSASWELERTRHDIRS